MAEVTLTIGGRHYDVHCRDGEERHLIRLAAMMDAKMAVARQSTPGLTEIRQLLFAGILLADEVHDLRAQGHNGQGSLDLPASERKETDEEAVAAHLDRLAARIEALADALAADAPSS
ncbi:MAG: cell division protein ZapA [Sphingobium sp.]